MQPVDTGSVEGALTLLYAAACLLGLVTLLMPMDPEIDISGQFAVALAAGVVAVGLHLARTLPRWGPMALVATGTVMTTAGIHFTAGVPSSASLFFLWIALFAFYFFSPRQAAAQMVLIVPTQGRGARRELLADLVRAGDAGTPGTRMELEAHAGRDQLVAA